VSKSIRSINPRLLHHNYETIGVLKEMNGADVHILPLNAAECFVQYSLQFDMFDVVV